ncbi:hypothetical protein [Neisseria sp.]|uniref:hypothetical protein n=1 Tax=Neisseria sp. TaxID=192066 RepID=UPI0026DCDA12|nr:hypothetical protein [Neisseria sp.]MDO4227785.1 hypothetical protein [Neisseria sp.]
MPSSKKYPGVARVFFTEFVGKSRRKPLQKPFRPSEIPNRRYALIKPGHDADVFKADMDFAKIAGHLKRKFSDGLFPIRY